MCFVCNTNATSLNIAPRFAQQFFAVAPAPFHVDPATKAPAVKRAKRVAAPAIADLEIVKCCHRFLRCDTAFYKTNWNWSEFLTRFLNGGCEVQRLYCNAILATLGNMSAPQLQQLNRGVAPQSVVARALMERTDIVPNAVAISDAEQVDDGSVAAEKDDNTISADLITWSFASSIVTSVQGVLLPIFDAENFRYYQRNVPVHARTVLVESTRQNLRSLALGIASDKAICLSGAVGCGKTSLVEYVAKLTGRVAIPWDVSAGNVAACDDKTVAEVTAAGGKRKKGGKKRAIVDDGPNDKQEAPLGGKPAHSGFLRIQLGDQTDSKMLLGQYRCTDVPGEFVWQAGALTQAVMHGYWLLLEDIDLATQDVTVALTNLLENNCLSVPGLNESLRIAPGFQLFVTLR